MRYHSPQQVHSIWKKNYVVRVIYLKSGCWMKLLQIRLFLSCGSLNVFCILSFFCAPRCKPSTFLVFKLNIVHLVIGVEVIKQSAFKSRVSSKLKHLALRFTVPKLWRFKESESPPTTGRPERSLVSQLPLPEASSWVSTSLPLWSLASVSHYALIDRDDFRIVVFRAGG